MRTRMYGGGRGGRVTVPPVPPIPIATGGGIFVASQLPTSRLLARNHFPVARDRELSSGCFEVKSAPQFSRSGYHDLDAQKIQALAVKKPCQRSASLLLCDRKL